VSPWTLLGWMLVAIVATAVVIRSTAYLLRWARSIAEAWPGFKEAVAIRLHVARCGWFEWLPERPHWPHAVDGNRRRHDGDILFRCRARATYRLTYGDLRCAEHKDRRHSTLTFSGQARPLYGGDR
jgi:hypothetical protein